MITKEQLEKRRKYLGASDVSALFTDEEGKSLNPFAMAYDVWVSKVYELEEGKSTDSQKRGNHCESGLLEYAKDELGVTIETGPDKLWVQCKEHPVFVANLDGYCLKDMEMCVIEAKSSGMVNEWGEPYTDQCPYRVIIQCQSQLLCTGWNTAYVPVLTGGRWGLTESMYVIKRNEEIINAIIKRGEDFWNNHVLTKIPPETSELGDIQLLKRIKRIPEKYADVDPALILQWENVKAERSAKEKEEKELFTKLLMELGDADGVQLPDGRELTYFLQNGAALVDRKRLENEYPAVWSAITSENTYRVARIRKI